MQGGYTPNFLDVARSLGKDPLNTSPESVEEFIRKEFRNQGGTFNYNTSISSLPSLFKGHISVEAAVEHCLQTGSPAGREQNANAVAVVGGYANAQISSCYKIPFSAVPVGRLSQNVTAYIAFKAPLVRVRQSEIYVVVPGFRLGHRPDGIEIDVAASLALANFARDDFEEADFEYLDCSRGRSGERELSVYHGRDRTIFNLDQVDQMVDIYIRGLARAIESGMDAREPNFRGYRIIDPNQPNML